MKIMAQEDDIIPSFIIVRKAMPFFVGETVVVTVLDGVVGAFVVGVCVVVVDVVGLVPVVDGPVVGAIVVG